MDNIIIRTVSIDDAEDVSIVCSEDMGYPCEISLVADRIRDLSVDREAVFVAEVKGSVVGFIHVEKYELLYFEAMANILGLAVRSEYRHNGIGKKLLIAAEDWALKMGIKGMRLNSGITRTGAHEFYRHLGYGHEKEQIRFEKFL